MAWCVPKLCGKAATLTVLLVFVVVAVSNFAAAADAAKEDCFCSNVTSGKQCPCLGDDIEIADSDAVRQLRYIKELKAENEWKNGLISWTLPSALKDALPHWALTWYRNCIGATLLYLISGGLWCLVVYYLAGKRYYTKEMVPEWSEMKKQIQVAMPGMPVYSALPTLAEWMVEQGWTKCYPAITNVGLPAYLAYFVAYMTWVEFGVYWVHRLLHEIKPAYRLLHATHHIYNKQNTLSPFAGLAFNPIDGCMQASPYVVALFFIPMHHFTHTLLLFATGVWTTNIHDCIHGNLWPVMGAGYHTIHHITYKHNYGHYLTVMDWIFGTLRTPPNALAGKVVSTACAPTKGEEAKAEPGYAATNGVSSATSPSTVRARAGQKKSS